MKKMYLLFGSLCLICAVGIIMSIFHVGCFKPSDGATLFAGLLAAAIVWWQGYLIQQQMQLQAVIDLDREWNSKEMLENRKSAWTNQHEVDKNNIDRVLEFLEKVSTLEKNGVISADLVWDTFGWYIWRYHRYCSSAIDELRRDWTPKAPDPTLYKDLQDLCKKLTKQEVDNRNANIGKGGTVLSLQDMMNELDMTKKKFIDSERRVNP